MASKSSNPVTTVYQCSECDHCSLNLEEATLHAVQEHGDDRDDDDDDDQEESEEESFPKIEIKEDKDLVSSDDEYSSSVYKQVNGNYEGQGEGQNSLRRPDVWSTNSTKSLIYCIQEHYSDLKSKHAKKKSIWEQIKSVLESQIPGISASKCEQRWKSLLTSQKKYLSGYNKAYGKSKYKKPEFFDEVAEVVGEDIPDFVLETDLDFSPFSTTIEGKVAKGKDSLAYSLQSLLHEDSPGSPLSALGNDAILVLGRLVAILERREAANEKFQREVLEMEREKLRCVQRFVEGREKFNAKRLQLMKEWMMTQPKAKRRRDDNDD